MDAAFKSVSRPFGTSQVVQDIFHRCDFWALGRFVPTKMVHRSGQVICGVSLTKPSHFVCLCPRCMVRLYNAVEVWSFHELCCFSHKKGHLHIADHEANVERWSNKYSKTSIITAPKTLPRMRPLTQKNTPKQSRSNVKLYTVTGWCSTRTLLLICSSCKKENGHPLSLSTPQINPAKLITTAAGGFFAKHYEKNACQIGSFFSMWKLSG